MSVEKVEEPPVFETKATRIKNKLKHFGTELLMSPLRFLRLYV